MSQMIFVGDFRPAQNCPDLDCQSAVDVPSEWDWPGYLERPEMGHGMGENCPTVG